MRGRKCVKGVYLGSGRRCVGLESIHWTISQQDLEQVHAGHDQVKAGGCHGLGEAATENFGIARGLGFDLSFLSHNLVGTCGYT
jgi:hypothetical protein